MLEAFVVMVKWTCLFGWIVSIDDQAELGWAGTKRRSVQIDLSCQLLVEDSWARHCECTWLGIA